MRVRLDVTAIQSSHVPVHLPALLDPRLERLEGFVPDPPFGPAMEAGRAGGPRTIACRDVSPGCAGSEHPEDAIDDGAVLFIGVAFFACFLGWQERFELVPLLVG